MDLTNCRECGKAFVYNNVGPKKCEECRKNQEEKFEIVKEYLWDNPNASIEKVHEETGVEKDLIISYVKEDRLVAEGLDVELMEECDRCGRKIAEGRFCEKCQQELVNGLKGSSGNNKKSGRGKRKKSGKSGQGMFLKDRIRKRRRGKKEDS